MIFGAYLNRKTIEEIAEVGKMLYKKRRVLDRLEEMNHTSKKTPIISVNM